MSIKRALGSALSVAFALTILPAGARANARDQATEFTFNQSVQVPGRTLPAGSYWFVLSTGTADRRIVRILNSDRSELYATILTVPVERESWTGRAPGDSQEEIRFAKRPSGRPDAVVEWFYPGRVTGHEFLYPSREENQLRQEAKMTVDLTPKG